MMDYEKYMNFMADIKDYESMSNTESEEVE